MAVAAISFAVAAFYTIQFVRMAIVWGSFVGEHNEDRYSVGNQHGDKATAVTIASGNWGEPIGTVVRLKLAHGWFSTVLVETKEFGLQYDLKWRNDNALVVRLACGCLVEMTPRVAKVGTVRISYEITEAPNLGACPPGMRAITPPTGNSSG